jgi:hypothetical protein
VSDLLAKDCYGINQLTPTLRIKRKLWHPPALFSSCFCLQEKGFLGLYWTISWNYVDVLSEDNEKAEFIERWLRWDASEYN